MSLFEFDTRRKKPPGLLRKCTGACGRVLSFTKANQERVQHIRCVVCQVVTRWVIVGEKK